ncbi:Casein kinase 1-like protein 5, partial [Lamellibrachia satsuma]
LENSTLIVGRSVKARVLELINRGSFGEIHRGVMLETNEEVAVKLEKQKAPCPQLLAEADVYRHLQGGPGIPKFYWGGLYDYEPFYNVLVIEYLGPSIQDLFAYCHHIFSLKTVLMLADQMLDIIQFIHENHFIYRDIKPDNFLIGVDVDTHRIYIVDFGLAKKYLRGRALRRSSSYHFSHPMVGTTRYASLHAHRGEDLSPRDDMESLAYVWIYLLRGNLPWQGLKAEHRDQTFAAVKEAKLSMTAERLCEGLPDTFASYLNYAKNMKMDDVPHYKGIKTKFQALAKAEGIVYDWQYDWNTQRE